jgi:hypothetical protein
MCLKLSSCVATVIAVVLAAPAAYGGVMCGRSVVLPGATQAEVLEKCGSPSRRQPVGGKAVGARSAKKNGGNGRETWVYDLGSRQLVRYLTFEHGRLRSIDFGGYGS